MPTASLPDLPKGREFEKLVAAIYQSSGLFVERDVTQRKRSTFSSWTSLRPTTIRSRRISVTVQGVTALLAAVRGPSDADGGIGSRR